MLINNNGINGNNVSNNQTKDVVESSEKHNNSSSPGDADSVKLSADAYSLTRLESAVANANDVDTNRVDAIRKAINDGSYTIDADAIATKLLNSDTLS